MQHIPAAATALAIGLGVVAAAPPVSRPLSPPAAPTTQTPPVHAPAQTPKQDSEPAEATPDQIIPIVVEAPIEWDVATADGTAREELRLYSGGQIIETTVELPPLPVNQRDAQRIIATLIVEPIITKENDKVRPGDPWPRLGNVSIVLPAKSPPSGGGEAAPDAVAAAAPSPASSSPPPASSGTMPPSGLLPPPKEAELMRFVTGFGAAGAYSQDVTALAPLLSGKTTLRVFISTYRKPAWNVTLTLSYTRVGVGYRRPIFAKPLFSDERLTAERNQLKAAIEIPVGLARPRLQIISTGHATDGTGGDEFISRLHTLKIDGKVVACWRPWSEDGGTQRERNPMSGRRTIGGRDLWSSDLDRSGWLPNQPVEPLRIPIPELTPGRHIVTLEIQGIRPPDDQGEHGYWRTSILVVADEPWPDEDHERKP